MGTGGRRWTAMLLCGLVALGAAACGDDDDGGSASAGATSAAAPASTTADVGDTEAGSGVEDYLKYVGGKAGAADSSKSPVVIGWVNQQGGPVDAGPGATKGAELAVKYINAELGGIDGHPVKLHTCFVSTAEEQGQVCGQQMVNDDDVSVVTVGAVALGSQSLVAAIGGDKPMVHAIATGGSEKNPDGYALFGDSNHVSTPYGTFAADVLKARKVAALWPEIPGVAAGAQATIDGAEASGLQVKRVSWQPNATDLVGPLTAAGGQSADAIILTSDPKGCVNFAKAIGQLKIDTPVVAQPLCLNPAVAKALGDLPQWYYGIASSLATDTKDPASVAFMKIAAKYGLAEEAGGDVWIPVSFAQILTVAQWLNKLGPDKITPQAVAAQAKAFKGPLAMGPPTVQCGKYPDAPAVCNDQAKFYEYEGKGTFTPTSGWVGPPA
jgi:branched-chain amino acid transport system substrate-binding protein